LTLDIYKVMHRHLVRFVDDIPPEKVTTKQLREFMVWLKTEYKNAHTGEPVSSSYLANAWKSIRSFFSWATVEFDFKRPDAHLKMPRDSHKVVSPFSKEEIKAILKACKYSRNYTMPSGKTFQARNASFLRNIALVLLLLDSGLRVGEVTRLNITNLNLNVGEITVASFGAGIKSKARHVYLGAQTKKAIWKYLQSRENVFETDPLFVSSFRNQRMSRFTIGKALRDIGKRAVVHKVHPIGLGIPLLFSI